MKKLLVMFMFLIFSTTMFAQWDSDTDDEQFYLEKFYLHFGIGYSANTYSNEYLDDLYSNADDYNLTRTPVFIDLGVYVPLDPKFMIGGAISGSGDRLTNDDGDWVQLNSYLFAVSAIYFFNYVHSGPFVRGDLGYTRGVSSNSNGETYGSEESDNGMGFNLGGGYAIQTSQGSSFMIELILSHKRIEDLEVSTLAIDISFFW